jgi:hypothetical protein
LGAPEAHLQPLAGRLGRSLPLYSPVLSFNKGARCWLFAALVGCVACAESTYEPVDWQLDLLTDQVVAIASARVCSTRALAKDFVVVDEHVVMPGLPNEGDVQVVVDVYDVDGRRFGSSGPVLLEQEQHVVPLLLCSEDGCDAVCVEGAAENGGERSLAIRFLAERD